MVFINTGGNDLEDKYEVLQSVLLPQTGQKEFLMETQRQLMNEFSFQIKAPPKDVKFFTLAGDPLPEDYLANGGTIASFTYIKKDGYLYVFRFNETHFYKIGFSKDPLQCAVDGWYDRNHPPELCKKLDIRYCSLVGLWSANRNEEEELHNHFHGKAKRGQPREFYRLEEMPAIKEYITEHFSISRDAEMWMPRLCKKRSINPPRLNCAGCGFGEIPKCPECGKEIKCGKIARHIQQVHKKIKTG